MYTVVICYFTLGLGSEPDLAPCASHPGWRQLNVDFFQAHADMSRPWRRVSKNLMKDSQKHLSV